VKNCTDKIDTVQSVHISPLGDWIAASYKTQILLIKASPIPENGLLETIRLTLAPLLIAQIECESSASMEFESTRFSLSEENFHIVTKTGKFVIKWAMRRILNGSVPCYTVLGYNDTEDGSQNLQMLCPNPNPPRKSIVPE
jgi:hypothetical protein